MVYKDEFAHYANKICFCYCAFFTATITDYAGNEGSSYGKASVLGTY